MEKYKVIDKAISALEDAIKFTNIAFEFEGDVFGVHHNAATDTISEYNNAIAELKAFRDIV